MQIFLKIMIWSLFLYINGLIVLTDYKYKKIPNRYLLWLLLLLPFNYLLFFLDGYVLDLAFILSFVFSLIVSFVLYYHGIWSAGDAKYLLVLSLFIPYIGIVPLIGNISITTIIYLFLYFIFFYLKLLILPENARSLYDNILRSNKDKLKIFLTNPATGKIHKDEALFKILKEVFFFLLFFVFLRLLRGDLFANIRNIGIIKNNISSLGSYMFLGGFILRYSIIFFYRKIFNGIKIRFKEAIKIPLTENQTRILNIIIASILLGALIIYDHSRTGEQVFKKIYLILTFYLALSVSIRILFYAYKLTFQISEQDHVDIKNLKEGDIVDKDHLIKQLGKQDCLGYDNEKGILYPDPSVYFIGISNPIDENTVKELKDIYNIVDDHHVKYGIDTNNEIKILKTFAFGGYILLGFLVTFVFGDGISKIIILTFTKIIKSYYH